MKCKKLFALLLSLCMIASSFVAVSVAAETEYVVDINLPLDDASELTWVQPNVTVSNADGIGGRDKVVKAEGLANSNNNTVGVKLPEGFVFQEGDILTYSIDVFSETAINPDMWLRNHSGSLNPFATFFEQTASANTWTTVSKTFTYDELNEKVAPSNSSGTFDTPGSYAFYIRPRSNATVYLDNLTLTVEREKVVKGNIIDIEVNNASDITWIASDVVTVSDADGIGGRDGVVKLDGLANSNNNTAGVVFGESFAFQEGDVLTYSYDIYSETAINPDMWVRNHGSALTPFITLYHAAIAANTWTTIERTVHYSELAAAGAFDTADMYAFYIRPRSSATAYIDNFKVAVSRIGYEESDDPVVTPTPTTAPTATPTPTVAPTATPTVAPTATPTTAPDGDRGNVVDINLPLDNASELTWVASDAVTVSAVDGIGGRDKVIKAEGLSNSNNNSVGVSLPDGFAFAEGDILTYSIDVYSETAINPDMWLRNHSGSLNPFAVLYEQTASANTWTTVSKTFTYDELNEKVASSNSSGTFDTPGNYKLYIRPRSAGTLYLDNFKVTVSRVGYVAPDDPIEPTPPPAVEDERITIYENEAPLDEAKELTWVATDAVIVTEADGIGGRDNVLKAEGLDNSNNNTVGMSLPDEFAFAAGDIVTISVDVYSDKAVKPDLWIRNHDSSLNPFVTFYHEGIAANTWTTVSKKITFEEMMDLVANSNSTGTFATAGKYAVYVRPRSAATLYLDNFSIKIEGYERSEIVGLSGYEVIEQTIDSVTIKATFSGNIVAKAIKDACSIAGREDDGDIAINVVRDENDKKNAVITITGLASSTKYELVMDGIVLPTATIAFETLDEATVEAILDDGKIKYSITNNTDETKEIYTVLLRCNGDTVIESIVIAPAEGGCASKGTVSGEKEISALSTGNCFRVFAWTFDNGNVNSLAPFVVIE